jgi:predicted transcriptional regulator
VAPRPAPPTDPLPPPTVQEEIALLLSGQSAWLTASEIASKLSADLGVVRTELSAMYASSLVERRSVRGKTTKEKYEYAQPVQRAQPQITPSA